MAKLPKISSIIPKRLRGEFPGKNHPVWVTTWAIVVGIGLSSCTMGAVCGTSKRVSSGPVKGSGDSEVRDQASLLANFRCSCPSYCTPNYIPDQPTMTIRGFNGKYNYVETGSCFCQ